MNGGLLLGSGLVCRAREHTEAAGQDEEDCGAVYRVAGEKEPGTARRGKSKMRVGRDSRRIV